MVPPSTTTTKRQKMTRHTESWNLSSTSFLPTTHPPGEQDLGITSVDPASPSSPAVARLDQDEITPALLKYSTFIQKMYRLEPLQRGNTFHYLWIRCLLSTQPPTFINSTFSLQICTTTGKQRNFCQGEPIPAGSMAARNTFAPTVSSEGLQPLHSNPIDEG